MENARATYDGRLRLEPDLRPFVLTRAAFAGAERYAATWTGDNSNTWNHMRISIPELLNLGLSGYAFVGDDIGGFNGSPTPELLTRWMELGAFNPIYRNHATKGSRNREPGWMAPNTKQFEKSISRRDIVCCLMSTPAWRGRLAPVFRCCGPCSSNSRTIRLWPAMMTSSC